MPRQLAFGMIGLAAGFSGLALIITILTGTALWITLGVLVLIPMTASAIIATVTPARIRSEVWHVARAGLIAGFAATFVYDVTRTTLSILDPSPYNPFEAVRQFGLGILGPDAVGPPVMILGLLFHFLNGSLFGVIYAMFGGRHVRNRRAALISGISWGLTLEFIQSILYPGWLGITTVLAEFLLISALGHIAYGVTLGLGVRWILRRTEGPSDRVCA